MSANNRRIRRVIVDLLYDYGPLTKDEMATLLAKEKTIRAVPSPHSLSSLLSKALIFAQNDPSSDGFTLSLTSAKEIIGILF